MSHESADLRRQSIYSIDMDSVLVCRYRNFNTCPLIYICYISQIPEVSVERSRSMVTEDRIEYVRSVLLSPVKVCPCLGFKPLLILILPCILAVEVFVQDECICARIPARAVGAVFLDEIRSLPEPRVVL